MTHVVIPEHLRALGNDAGLLAKLVDEGLRREPPPIVVESSCDFVGERLAALCRMSDRLAELVGGPLAHCAARSDCAPEASHRVMGRLEQILNDMLDEYAMLRGLRNTDPLDRRDFTLIVDAFRHPLDEIRRWLQRLSDVTVNPEKALKSHPDHARDGCLEIPLALTLTPPPQLDELEQRIARKQATLRRNDGSNKGGSLMGIILGVAAAHWLFGGGNCS